MSFWSEVDDLIDKGKTDKTVKVVAQELIDIRAEMIEDKGKLEALEVEYEKLREENAELAYLATGVEQKLSTMQQSLQSQEQSKMGEFQQQNQELLNQNRELAQKIQELQMMQGQSASQEELEAKDRQISALNLNIQELTNQLQHFRDNQVSKEDFDALKFQNQQYQQQIAAGTQQLAALQHQIEELKVDVAHKDKLIKELREPRSVMAPTLSKSPAPTPTASTGYLGGVGEPDIGLHRHQCPKCNGVKIREVEDKTKIVSYIPKVMYGHKLICQTCRYEWNP